MSQGQSSRGQMYSKAQGLWCEVAVWLNQWWLQSSAFCPYSLALWPQESLSVLQFTQFMGNSEAQGTHHFVDAPLFPAQPTQAEACN